MRARERDWGTEKGAQSQGGSPDRGLHPVLAAAGCSTSRPWPHCLRVSLKHVDWETDQGIGGCGEEPGIKSQPTNLVRSVRTVMRVPLTRVNSTAVASLFLSGWSSMGGIETQRDARRSYYFGRSWNIHILAGHPRTWQQCKPDNKTRVPIYVGFFFQCFTYSFITERSNHQKQKLTRSGIHLIADC